MSKILIKSARIIDIQSPFHGQAVDVLIENGVIHQIQTGIEGDFDQTLDVEGICVSPALMDVGTFVGDPGLEHRENFESLEKQALNGGYSDLLCLPNTNPAMDTKSAIQYMLKQTKDMLVNFHPIGAVTKSCAGEDIAEMIDMHHAGSLAFSDGIHSIKDTGVLMRALQYAKHFNGLVLNFSDDKHLSAGGQMHEGKVSTSLGLKGIPSLSEYVSVYRDIQLAEYCDAPLHIMNISTKESVALIAEAKVRGVQITASVAVLNLLQTVDALAAFSTDHKVQPPLRSESDRLALIDGVKTGVIDLITSNHRPYESELKSLEYTYAEFGAAQIETAFSAAYTALNGAMTLEQIVEIMANKPRQLLGMERITIDLGQKAELFLYRADEEYVMQKENSRAIAFNNPLFGEQLKGKVYWTIIGEEVYS